MLCGIWWKEVVIVGTEIKIIGVHEETVDIDVQSLLFWEPDLGSDAVSTIVVKHMDSEVLRWNAGEHDLILQASGDHREEG